MLDDWHLRIMIQAQAIMVEVEGMKVENSRWKSPEFSTYNEGCFDAKRQELEDLANQLRY